MATVDTAGAGDVLAIAAGRDEVRAGAMPDVKSVRAALAADALGDDVLTSGSVAADGTVADAEPCSVENRTRRMSSLPKRPSQPRLHRHSRHISAVLRDTDKDCDGERERERERETRQPRTEKCLTCK